MIFCVCGRVGGSEKTADSPPTAQDPKSLKPQKSRGAILRLETSRAARAGSVRCLHSRRLQDEPAGGLRKQDDARKAASRIARARDPPSPLPRQRRDARRRRRSARRPKNADQRTGPDSTQRDMASSPHIEARHLEVPRAGSHRGRVSMTRRAALPRRREKQKKLRAGWLLRPFCVLTTKCSNSIGAFRFFQFC